LSELNEAQGHHSRWRAHAFGAVENTVETAGCVLGRFLDRARSRGNTTACYIA